MYLNEIMLMMMMTSVITNYISTSKYSRSKDIFYKSFCCTHLLQQMKELSFFSWVGMPHICSPRIHVNNCQEE